jgi:ubiquinone/menaquinone biosynthesis C-methylase UbiE
MLKRICLLILLILIATPAAIYADSGESTRIVDPNQHAYGGDGRYPYRQKSDYVLKELDLKAGDVIVDIGAGDGFWARQMAKSIGDEGVIYASEVDQKKVNNMKEKLVDVSQIKPYLSPLDGTDLPENSCDLAFLSKTYHHFNEGGHVDYLRHLRKVVKPTGRLCVIEMNPALGSGRGRQHAWSPGLLIQQAEEAGWIIVRCELITGTNHYVAIFVQKELFGQQPSRGRREAKNDEN